MKRSDLAVYFIMGTENCVKAPLETLEEALAAGITMFQLREKGPHALKGRHIYSLRVNVRPYVHNMVSPLLLMMMWHSLFY